MVSKTECYRLEVKASYREKYHLGLMGQDLVLTNSTSFTKIRHPPALPPPPLRSHFGMGTFLHTKTKVINQVIREMCVDTCVARICPVLISVKLNR